MMGAYIGTLAVLAADWSVITKYGGVFDLMHINELHLSVPATVGNPLSCRADAEQLLTSDINPSVVTRTFVMSNVFSVYFFSSVFSVYVFFFVLFFCFCFLAFAFFQPSQSLRFPAARVCSNNSGSVAATASAGRPSSGDHRPSHYFCAYNEILRFLIVVFVCPQPSLFICMHSSASWSGLCGFSISCKGVCLDVLHRLTVWSVSVLV